MRLKEDTSEKLRCGPVRDQEAALEGDRVTRMVAQRKRGCGEIKEGCMEEEAPEPS